MKTILLVLLVVYSLAGTTSISQWNLPDSLPSCYTGLPFKFPLGTNYFYSSSSIPSWATIDSKEGAITGQSKQAGAWPISIQVKDGKGNSINKQYILNVVDSKTAQNSIWASDTDKYYERNVINPFRISPSASDSTAIQVGEKFSYTFDTKNKVGNPVFAFLNLPTGLSGNATTGTISGAFTVPGIYTLGVESADQSGSTAEGFVTITAGKGGAAALSKVTVNNQVPFVYDISAIQEQQVQADKLLFAALAEVNAARAEVATRQGLYDGANVKLASTEAAADKAAALAAQANTDRQNAAKRLGFTNSELNDAEDKLNLALLYQAGAQANVKKAESTLADAQRKFEATQNKLANAEKILQNAQTALTAKQLAQALATTNVQNARKDYNRANQDLNSAKDALKNSQGGLQQAQALLTKAKNDLTLATQAWDQAEKQLKESIIQLANAQAANQAALKSLKDYTASNQQSTNKLGSAEWNLHQAISSLNIANAAKASADRTSALVIANGVPQSVPRVDTSAKFTSCSNTGRPSYAGSVKISSVYGDRALLSTGNTILWGSCSKGVSSIVAGSTITITGAINPASKCIEVHSVAKSQLK